MVPIVPNSPARKSATRSVRPAVPAPIAAGEVVLNPADRAGTTPEPGGPPVAATAATAAGSTAAAEVAVAAAAAAEATIRHGEMALG